MSKKNYDAELAKLEVLLRQKPVTARQIATELGCCQPTAYERVRALMTRGVAVFTIKATKSNKSGPRAVEYGIR